MSPEVKKKAITKQPLKSVRCLNMQMIPSAGDLFRHTDTTKGASAGRRQVPGWPEPY